MRKTWSHTVGATMVLAAAFATGGSALLAIAIGSWKWLRHPTLQHYVDMLSRWQTLFSGLWAIGAALGAGYMVWKQIQNDKEIIRAGHATRLAALRALSPIRLYQLCDYTDRCATVLKRIHAPSPGQMPNPDPAGLDAALSHLAEMSALEAGSTAQVLRLTIREVQIQNTKLVNFISTFNTTQSYNLNELVFRMRDLTLVRDRLNSLFRYARHEDKAPPEGLEILLDDSAMQELWNGGEQYGQLVEWRVNAYRGAIESLSLSALVNAVPADGASVRRVFRLRLNALNIFSR